MDSIAPTILIYDRPATGLEAKFSMPFCAAAAVVVGRVGIDTFDAATSRGSASVTALMPRVAMRVDPALDAAAPPLTQARVHIRLRDGRVLTQEAPTARAAIRSSRRATPSWTRSSWRARAGRCRSRCGAALALLRELRRSTTSAADSCTACWERAAT